MATALVLLVWLGSGTALAEDACTARYPVERLQTSLRDADDALGQANVEDFRRHIGEASLMLPCVSSVLPTLDAARFQLLEGIYRYVILDINQAKPFLCAARALGSDAPPVELFDEEHEVQRTFQSCDSQGGATRKLPAPRGASLYFDGRDDLLWPRERTTIFQFQDGDGTLTSSAMMTPIQDIPPYAGQNRRRNTLWTTAAATAVTAGVMYSLAWSSRARFEQGGQSLTEVERQRARANAFSVGAGVAGGVAAAATVGAVVQGRW